MVMPNHLNNYFSASQIWAGESSPEKSGSPFPQGNYCGTLHVHPRPGTAGRKSPQHFHSRSWGRNSARPRYRLCWQRGECSFYTWIPERLRLFVAEESFTLPPPFALEIYIPCRSCFPRHGEYNFCFKPSILPRMSVPGISQSFFNQSFTISAVKSTASTELRSVRSPFCRSPIGCEILSVQIHSLRARTNHGAGLRILKGHDKTTEQFFQSWKNRPFISFVHLVRSLC